MKFVTNAKEIAAALKHLRPRGRKPGSRNYPAHSDITAGGSAVVLLSQLACSASVSAVVEDAGTGKFPHESALMVLSSYRKGIKVTIQVEPDCIWIDKLRLSSGLL
jgi:hypothetical protein